MSEVAVKPNNDLSKSVKAFLTKYSIYFILVLLVAILTFLSPAFLKPVNLINIVRQISLIAIVGFGVTMIIITTGIDLSSGSVIAVAGIVASKFAHPDTYPLAVALILGLGVGLLAGAINGFFVSIVKLPAFIATLGMMLSFRGVGYILSEGHPITNFTKEYDFIGSGYWLGLPLMIYILFGAAVLSYVILRHTKTGKCIYAIGGNQQAAVVSGINVKKNLMFVYSYAGMMSALAGIMLSSRLSSGQPTAGLTYEMDAISSAVIGGTSLSGGIGTIQGTLIGALIIGVLNNGMDLMHINAYYQQVVKGSIIVLAVILDKARNR
ncbi:MAG: ribose ABC transporter permease [Eubacteriales bacterium]|nr:ribose ABC transporter permease [Eubacteriales bacterium]